jgi:phosphoesterase RecJ-like protein
MNAADFQPVIDRLKVSRAPAITIHQNPDADTVGSALALAWALEQLKLRAQLIAPALPLPIDCAFLPGADRFKTRANAKTDLLISVDTAVPRLLPESLPECEMITIDHHGSNPGYGVLNLIDPQVAATGVVVMDLIEAMGVALNRPIATNLYAAIASDSRFFSIDRVDAPLFERTARLVRVGADPAAIAQGLRRRSLAQMRLLGRALLLMRLHCAGRFALVLIDHETLKASGAEPFGIVDELLQAVTVEVAAVVVEQAPHRLKGSIRSQNGIDVAQVAAVFGGGGHKAASGFRTEGALEAIGDRLVALIEPLFSPL